MKKLITTSLLIAALAAICAAQAPSPTPYVRPSAEKRFKNYLKDVTGPIAWGGMVGGAAFSTAFNSPEEWHGTWEGFGKRVASNFGKNFIRTTVSYGLDEALKVDSHFYISENRSVNARIKNALISPVAARKPNGKRVIGIPKIAGTYGANLIAYNTWYPNRYDWKDAMWNGTVNLGASAVYNLVREFVFKK